MLTCLFYYYALTVPCTCIVLFICCLYVLGEGDMFGSIGACLCYDVAALWNCVYYQSPRAVCTTSHLEHLTHLSRIIWEHW
jgi:hypothetical protein